MKKQLKTYPLVSLSGYGAAYPFLQGDKRNIDVTRHWSVPCGAPAVRIVEVHTVGVCLGPALHPAVIVLKIAEFVDVCNVHCHAEIPADTSSRDITNCTSTSDEHERHSDGL